MIREAIALVVEGKHLTAAQMTEVWEQITGGEATPAQIASLITALRVKGETVEEITAAARVMRRKAARVLAAEAAAGVGVRPGDGTVSVLPLMDTCGTGGDQTHTFNISTATAFVVAGAGVPVAKHGNRSVSSKCGSADVCEALGINLDLTPEQMGASIREVGIGFLFAPLLHATMKHAVGPRREIGIRTIFNVLGPLANPAGAACQMMGVYRGELTAVIAEVLGNLGCGRAMVVHGDDGMDEITVTGSSRVSEWADGSVRTYTVHPEAFGLRTARIDDLHGASAPENAAIIREIFEGRAGPRRDIVLLNAGAALYVAGTAPGIAEGIDLARDSIDSGKAREKLDALVEHSNRPRPASERAAGPGPRGSVPGCPTAN